MKKLILFSSILFLFSCTKNELDYMDNNDNSRSGSCTDTLNAESIINTGVLHNFYLEEGLRYYDFETTDIEAELREQFLGLSIASGELTTFSSQVKDSIIDLAISLQGNEISDYAQYMDDTAGVYSHYTDVQNAIDTFENIEELNSILDDIKTEVLANLQCTDKDLLLICIEVARNSAELWAPTAIGGEEFLGNLGFQNITERAWPGWRSVIVSDVGGAAGAFMYMGVAGAIGAVVPGSNIAIAGAVGFSAGFSSAMTALGCC